MDRKSFIKTAYSKYWMTAREKRYGFSAYDKSLCHMVSNSVAQGGSLLDVGVGTGFPFAHHFDQNGYQVHGVDISPDLISKCQKLYPTVKARVGDAEALDFPSDLFDAVYCFHSSWYFPNLEQAMDEMLRVTKPGGIIAFDVQNARNPRIADAYQRRLDERSGLGMVKRQLKNVAKTLLRRGVPTWRFLIYEVPTSPEFVFSYARQRNLENVQVYMHGNGEELSVVKREREASVGT